MEQGHQPRRAAVLNGEVEIRPATPADIPHVIAILRETAQWLVDRGQGLWDPNQFTIEKMQASFDAGDWHIARVDSHPAAVATLTFEDEILWPEIPAGEAIFLHRTGGRAGIRRTGIAG